MAIKTRDTVDFPISSIRNIQTALANESAGNSRCTMTDLDLAVSMLGELIRIKTLTEYKMKRKS